MSQTPRALPLLKAFRISGLCSVGTLAVLVLTFVTRNLRFAEFKKAVSETIRPTCMIMMLVGSSAVLSHFIAMTGIPALAAGGIAKLPVPGWLIIAIIMLVYLAGGSLVDDLAFAILATPIFFPVAMKLGYDPLWFNIMISLTIGIGVVIPPVAICVFIVKNITKVPLNVIYKGVYPFLIALVGCAVLLFVFPGLATWLPSVLYK